MSNIIAFPNNRTSVRHVNTHERKQLHAVKAAALAETVTPMRKRGWQGARAAPEVLISVVVPTCNRPQLLDRCLTALAAQDYDPERFEIIVVDDAPGGPARTIVELWNKRLSHWGPRIFYVPSFGPHGPAAARNFGWQEAHGMLIAFTDDDTIPHPDWLTRGSALFDGRVQAAWGRIVMPLDGIPTDYERDAKGLEQAEFVTANCFCLKHVLAGLGGFDERFRLAWREDADLYFRLLQAGTTIAYAPEAIVEHPIRPAPWGVSVSQQKKIQFDALLFKKHRELYRQKIRASARWDYYLIVLCLVMMLAALALHRFDIALAAACGWVLLSARFCLQRLRGTVSNATHIAEMITTSLMIPPLAVFWRLVGIVRFRVGFI